MACATFFFSALMHHDAKAVARGLCQRDPDVLDVLIEQYQYRLFRYLVYLTASRETAEDLFQETWIRVLDRGHQYDGESKFETWLFAVARHLFIDFSRRKNPQSLDALTAPDDGASWEIAASGPSPLDLAFNRETEQSLHASLDQLSPTHREVLLLRFQEDLSLEEISKVLNVPLSTVKSRLYRGLEALRGLVAGRES